MSWAALLAKDKGKSIDFGAPQQRVYAHDSALEEAERRLHNLSHDTTQTIQLPVFAKGLLVLDANAMIKGFSNLPELADVLVTTTQVLAEVRDRAARDVLEKLSGFLIVLDPTPGAIHEVVECAEKTGDLGALSRTDVRVCALALDCARAANALRPAIAPTALEVNPPTAGEGGYEVVTDVLTDDDDEAKERDAEASGTEPGDPESAATAGRNAWPSSPAKPPHEARLHGKGKGRGKGRGEGEGEDSEDEGDWITPENLHQVQMGDAFPGRRGGAPPERFDGGVACVTADYAMQNTLLHLGVPIIGVAGMRIRELRWWLLRCTACFTLVKDTTRQFCPACGSGDTLRRVNYVLDRDGRKRLFINFKKPISTRGTIYNLPKPRGGKRGTNRTLVLREDQLAQVIHGTSGATVKERAAQRDGGDEELAPFGAPVRSKKRGLMEPKTVSSYHKYNVNEKRKQRAARKK